MESEERDRLDETRSLWAEAGQYMGYGMTWALSVLLFLMAGWWLDDKAGTSPLLVIVGAFVGAAAGFYSLYRHVVALGKDRTDGVESGER